MARITKRMASTILAAACGLVLAGCGSKGITREVTVAGNVAWTDTGLDVQAQQQLVVDAVGEVAANPENRTSPDGFVGKPEWRRYNVVPDAPHMALIGRIGPAGRPFLVGAAFRAPAPASGRLFLGINDRDTANNGGAFKATVTVK